MELNNTVLVTYICDAKMCLPNSCEKLWVSGFKFNIYFLNTGCWTTAAAWGWCNLVQLRNPDCLGDSLSTSQDYHLGLDRCSGSTKWEASATGSLAGQPGSCEESVGNIFFLYARFACFHSFTVMVLLYSLSAGICWLLVVLWQ